MGFSPRRLLALVGREAIQIVRDRPTLILILLTPLLELFLFAYAIDLQIDHIPTAVADQSLDNQSLALLNALQVSEYFDLELYVESEADVIRLIDEGRVRAGVVIPPDFAGRVERGEAQALILLDGSDSYTVQAGYGAAVAIVQDLTMALMVEKMGRAGGALGVSVAGLGERLPITTSVQVLYNPTIDDMTFIVPTMIGVLLQVLAVNMMAISVVRERELGTIEGLLITPTRPLELLVGKMIPNVVLCAISMLTIILLGVYWFGVPFRGDWWLFGWLCLLFLVTGLGLGLLISTIARTQREAQQMSMLLLLLSFLLTGFIYPREPMPLVVQWIGDLIPLTYFNRIVRGIFSKGVGMEFLWSDVLALAVYGTVVMTVAAAKFRKRLD